jgi:aspartokinase-like uncharacterized kinase
MSVVVKVGGSLYDLPGLGARLRAWLDRLPCREVLLVPGGGPAADVVRDLDRLHQLGEEAAHWLALRALAVNARFLAALLPGAVVVGHPDACPAAWQAPAPAVLDPHAFARADEGRPGALPHAWAVTSDSLAARAAAVARARRLVLLKSAPPPGPLDWAEAGRLGFVDGHFAHVVSREMEVEAVNFREWRP